MIADLSAYIATKTGLTLGTDIQVNARMNPDQEHMLLQESGGPGETPASFGQYGFQVISRHKDPVQARVLAYKVYDAIHATYAINISNYWTVHGFLALSYPQFLQTTEEGWHEFTTNYTATISRR